MEKLIVYGRVNSFLKKDQSKTLYTFEYLELESGRARTDFISYDEFEKIKSQNIPTGTTLVGQISINEYDKPYVSSVSIN